MADAAKQEPFKQVAKRLHQEFVWRGYDGKPPENIAKAYLDYVLKRERIRRGAILAGPRHNGIDYETLETLKNAQLGDPKFVEAEAIFLRLETDLVLALIYYERLITQKADQ